MSSKWWLVLAASGVLALGVAACGDDDDGDGGSSTPSGLSGDIRVDGSSTVGPLTEAIAEEFNAENPDVKVTVGTSGTGGGFEKFCAGETDISDASRPIEPDETKACQAKGISYQEIQVANDGITLVTSKQNTWAQCLTTAELKKIWDTGSKADSWKDVRSSFPDVPLKLFGPGTDSGTFDFFTEAINGQQRRSRSDYTASEDDNILVQGVSGTRGGLGYFGLSYFEQNRSRLNDVAVDSGGGCVKPSRATVQRREYKPLSRSLYIYAKRDSFRRSEVRSFIGFALNNQARVARNADFVALTTAQAKRARFHYNTVLRQVR